MLPTTLLVLVVLLSSGAEAQEAPPPIYQLEYGQEDLSGEVGVVSASGRIHIRRGDFELEIEDGGVVLWVDPAGYRGFRQGLGGPAAAPADGPPADGPPAASAPAAPGAPSVLGTVFLELYAEGGVVLRRDGVEVRAERMFFNFVRNRAVVVDAEIIVRPGADGSGLGIPLSVRAARLYQVAKDELNAGSARVTTCLYGEPHYELTVGNVSVRRSGTEGASFQTSGNVLRAGDVPIFWSPFTFGNTKTGTEPIRDVYTGNSSRFGPVLGVKLGGGIRPGEGEEEKLRGEWGVEAIWRSRRGLGLGGELLYELDDGEGELRAFYQRDRQDFDHTSGAAIPREERGRVRWQHRQDISDDFLGGRLSGLAEAAWISDRGFLREYYHSEEIREKEQEDAIHLDWKRSEHALGLTGKWRANEFQTQTEYRPRFEWDGTEMTLAEDVLGLGPLSLSGEAEAARVFRSYDHRRPERGADTDRVGARGALHLPFPVGIVKVSPEFGGGVTSYSGHQDHGRADLWAAVRAATDFWRVFPEVSSELLQLDGLRHVVSLSAGWVDRFRVSTGSSDLVVQDPEDLLDEMRAIDVGVRNRLSTKRAGAVVDFLDFDLRAIWFPDRLEARPAPFDPREEWGGGISSLLLSEEEKWRSIERRGMGPLVGRLRLQLRSNLSLLGDGWYDFETHGFETWAAAIQYEAFPDLGIYVGHRAIRDDSAVVTGSVDLRLTDRWSVQVYHQADLRDDGALVSGIDVRRRYHDFLIEFQFRHNSTQRETSFTVTVEPAFLFDREREARGPTVVDYSAPRWYR